METVTLALNELNSVSVNLFGATVTSWICNGKERLFVSSKAVFDGKKAIRGGIPVVFPNFGPWSLGPQHGFARISLWKHEATHQENPETVSDTFSLTNNSFTEAMWDHKFTLCYKVTLSTNSLQCTLDVNNTGDTVFDFTTLLHTYIKVKDIHSAAVTNLHDIQYIDKLKGGAEFREKRQLVDAVNGADSVYMNTGDTHVVSGCEDNSNISISKVNLPDTVIWNPWAENAAKMADFGDEEYQNMICVEPGAVSNRVVLQPGDSKHFRQDLQVVSLQ